MIFVLPAIFPKTAMTILGTTGCWIRLANRQAHYCPLPSFMANSVSAPCGWRADWRVAEKWFTACLMATWESWTFLRRNCSGR